MCDSICAAACITVGRLNRLLLIHLSNNILKSTVFTRVLPLSTVTTLALKLRAALVFTFVLSLASVLALLSFDVFASLA